MVWNKSVEELFPYNALENKVNTTSIVDLKAYFQVTFLVKRDIRRTQIHNCIIKTFD